MIVISSGTKQQSRLISESESILGPRLLADLEMEAIWTPPDEIGYEWACSFLYAVAEETCTYAECGYVQL